MIKKWDMTIPELSGDEPRAAYLYLPDSYLQEPNRRFPVLYMFDGHNVFYDSDATYGKSWGMKEYMDETKTPLLIAAVSCNQGANHERLDEYSPYDFQMRDFSKPEDSPDATFPVTGRGKQTMDWFAYTFKPWIDSHYRTLPNRKHTLIAGSSMGGLMSLYAVLHYNHVFSRAAALSPSLWADTAASKNMIDSADPKPDTVIYMDFGAKEWHRQERITKSFGNMSNLLLQKNIQLTARIIPDGTHCEASWEKQIPFFIPTLLYDLK